jgi:hypothetical protein
MMKGGSFRVRRVADWLGAAAAEDTTKTGGLAGGQGKVVTKTELASHPIQLEISTDIFSKGIYRP